MTSLRSDRRTTSSHHTFSTLPSPATQIACVEYNNRITAQRSATPRRLPRFEKLSEPSVTRGVPCASSQPWLRLREDVGREIANPFHDVCAPVPPCSHPPSVSTTSCVPDDPITMMELGAGRRWMTPQERSGSGRNTLPSPS